MCMYIIFRFWLARILSSFFLVHTCSFCFTYNGVVLYRVHYEGQRSGLGSCVITEVDLSCVQIIRLFHFFSFSFALLSECVGFVYLGMLGCNEDWVA